MTTYLAREREVEGGATFKIWSSARRYTYSCEIPIMMVERYRRGL